MSESDLGRKWDRCMADAVVKLGKGFLPLAGPARSQAVRAGEEGNSPGVRPRPALAPPARVSSWSAYRSLGPGGRRGTEEGLEVAVKVAGGGRVADSAGYDLVPQNSPPPVPQLGRGACPGGPFAPLLKKVTGSIL
jgi:hypothetical protein